MAKSKKAKEEEFIYEIDDEAIESADRNRGLTGPHIVTIHEAVLGKTKSGAQFVSLRVSINGRKNSDGEPIRYSIGSDIDDRRIYLTSGDSKGCQPLRTRPIFNAIFKLLDVKPKLGKAASEYYDFEKSEFRTKDVLQFTELLGKEIGMVIQQKNVWPQKLINGYTKDEVYRNQELKYEEDLDFIEALNNPEYLYIDDVKADPRPSFIFMRWFDAETGQTWTEKKDDKNPEKIQKLLSKLGDVNESPATDAQLDEFIVKKLKKQLGKNFDAEQVVSYSGIDTETPAPF